MARVYNTAELIEMLEERVAKLERNESSTDAMIDGLSDSIMDLRKRIASLEKKGKSHE